MEFTLSDLGNSFSLSTNSGLRTWSGQVLILYAAEYDFMTAFVTEIGQIIKDIFDKDQKNYGHDIVWRYFSCIPCLLSNCILFLQIDICKACLRLNGLKISKVKKHRK